MGDSSEEESSQECDPTRGSKVKDLVHKCYSDPGKVLLDRHTGMRAVGRGGPTRKCVLTLDGYSYVIGEVFYCLLH